MSFSNARGSMSGGGGGGDGSTPGPDGTASATPSERIPLKKALFAVQGESSHANVSSSGGGGGGGSGTAGGSGSGGLSPGTIEAARRNSLIDSSALELAEEGSGNGIGDGSPTAPHLSTLGAEGVVLVPYW
jgi:hypothetical protein